MMDPDRRIADTTVVRLENERDALKREVKRYKAFVAAFDAYRAAPFGEDARRWAELMGLRAALDAARPGAGEPT